MKGALIVADHILAGQIPHFLKKHKSKSNSRKISFKYYYKFLNNLIHKTILLFYFKFTKN